MPVKTAAAVMVLGVLMTGCSFNVSFGGLDIAELETEIDRGIEEQTGMGIAEVACPDEVEPAAGETFTCTARADDGTSLVVTVTQSDEQGNVTWQVTSSS